MFIIYNTHHVQPAAAALWGQVDEHRSCQWGFQALLWKAFDNFPYHSPRCFDLLVLDWIGTSLLFCLAFGWASAGTFASTCTEGPSNFVSSLLLAWTSSVPARLAWAWNNALSPQKRPLTSFLGRRDTCALNTSWTGTSRKESLQAPSKGEPAWKSRTPSNEEGPAYHLAESFSGFLGGAALRPRPTVGSLSVTSSGSSSSKRALTWTQQEAVCDQIAEHNQAGKPGVACLRGF